MSKLRAWVMVVIRPIKSATHFSVADTIKQTLGLRTMAVLGPYDIVVEVAGKSVEEIYRNTKLIYNLESVASATTYMAINRSPSAEPIGANACVLIDTTSQDIEYVQAEIARLEEIQEADIVLGAFDIIAMANLPVEKFAGFLDVIRKIQGVIRVILMPGLS